MGQLLPRKGGKSCASYPPHSSLAAAPGPELRKKGVTSDYKEFKECRGRCDFSLRRETPRAAKRGESEFRTWSGPASTEESLDLIREFEHRKIEQYPLPCVLFSHQVSLLPLVSCPSAVPLHARRSDIPPILASPFRSKQGVVRRYADGRAF